MTVAAAIRHGENVFVAVDSAATNAEVVSPKPFDKTRQIGRLFVALSGLATMGWHVERAVERATEGLSAVRLDEPLAWAISRQLRAQLFESGWQSDKNDDADGHPTTYDVNLLLTDGRRLFYYAITLEPLEMQPGVLATAGSGGRDAEAAFRALQPYDAYALPDRLARATLVPCELCVSGCAGPVYVYQVDRQGLVSLYGRWPELPRA